MNALKKVLQAAALVLATVGCGEKTKTVVVEPKPVVADFVDSYDGEWYVMRDKHTATEGNFLGVNPNTGENSFILDPNVRFGFPFLGLTNRTTALFYESVTTTARPQSDLQLFDIRNGQKIFDTDTDDAQEWPNAFLDSGDVIFTSYSLQTFTQKLKKVGAQTPVQDLLANDHGSHFLSNEHNLVVGHGQQTPATWKDKLYQIDQQGNPVLLLDLNTVPDSQGWFESVTRPDKLVYHDKNRNIRYRDATGQELVFVAPDPLNEFYNTLALSNDGLHAIVEANNVTNSARAFLDVQFVNGTSTANVIDFSGLSGWAPNQYLLNAFTIGRSRVMIQGTYSSVPKVLFYNGSALEDLIDPHVANTGGTLDEVYVEEFGDGTALVHVGISNNTPQGRYMTKLLYFNGDDVVDHFNNYDHVWVTERNFGDKRDHVAVIGVKEDPVTKESKHDLLLFNMNTGSIVPLMVDEDKTKSGTVVFSRDGQKIAWGTTDHKYDHSELFVGDVNGVFDKVFSGRSPIRPAAFTRDGKKCIAQGSAEWFSFDVDTGEQRFISYR